VGGCAEMERSERERESQEVKWRKLPRRGCVSAGWECQEGERRTGLISAAFELPVLHKMAGGSFLFLQASQRVLSLSVYICMIQGQNKTVKQLMKTQRHVKMRFMRQVSWCSTSHTWWSLQQYTQWMESAVVILLRVEGTASYTSKENFQM